MGDIVMLFFLQNIIVFSFIFWGLTILGSYFYKKKITKLKEVFMSVVLNLSQMLISK